MPIVLVRRYSPSDRDAVRRIHAAAFGRDADSAGQPSEVALLDALIAAGDVVPALSLVAVVDGEPVGHVVCSRATVGPYPAAGLGPIGVLPAQQGRGVGAALMHAVLAAADALELPLVALLGSPAFYSRFGFVAATSLGVGAPEPEWGDHFQVRALSEYEPGISGRFRYAPAFDLV